ncbi:hypothetical protein Cgig2_012965 [Carnegiea gigantea]|uniref:Uncharacterized protein n=1 Tax=Carnegiea gigantea TaxID=171969 RepID=A0A9Q1GNZ2_9CARY|nr:hypothetical protein Cgig2_012965 [Carnegiea gigantea]
MVSGSGSAKESSFVVQAQGEQSTQGAREHEAAPTSAETSRGRQGVVRPVAEDGPALGKETGPDADTCTDLTARLPQRNGSAAIYGPLGASQGSPRPGPSEGSGTNRPTDNETTAQPNVPAEPDHNKRTRRAPSRLQDYICYNTSLKDPSTRALMLQKASSEEVWEASAVNTTFWAGQFRYMQDCIGTAMASIDKGELGIFVVIMADSWGAHN